MKTADAPFICRVLLVVEAIGQLLLGSRVFVEGKYGRGGSKKEAWTHKQADVFGKANKNVFW